jgi:hypothetical protein
MTIDQIPGVEVGPLPTDQATLAPLLSLGMFDEDAARVFIARFSLATIHPFGPCRKGRAYKVAGCTPKLWSWLTDQHIQLTVAWINLYQQQFRPVEVRSCFLIPTRPHVTRLRLSSFLLLSALSQ